MRSRGLFLIPGLLVAMAVGVTPLAAQGRGQGPTKPPHVAAPGRGAPHGPHTTPPGVAKGRGQNAHTPKPSTGVSSHLSQQPVLTGKLSALLPPGTNVQAAAVGFKSLGQFVAAVHVSHNLGIPFNQLRARLIGPNAMSLGQAINQLNPSIKNVDREVRRAEAEAREDMKSDKR